MTSEWKADKSLNWLDAWKEMERIYRAHPEKVRAIGTRLCLVLPGVFSNSLVA